MRVLSIHVENFGSYRDFSFDFSDEGLSLIYGATGSGKSTFMDIVPWVLFGTTAKNGNVDEVRSWQTPDESTKGTAYVDLGDERIQITRIRGKAGQNDLYWTEDNHDYRGKDLSDTQRLLEARLNISGGSYLSAGYFHEFSPTGSFWTATAKDRRKLFEGIASLEFPATIASKASESRKEAKKTLEGVEVSLAGIQGRLEQARALLEDTKVRSKDWDKAKETMAQELATRAARFEVDRSMEITKQASLSAAWEALKAKQFEDLASELLALEKKIKKPEDLDAEIRRHTSQARCDKCQSLPISANAGIMQLQQQKTANNYNVKYFEQGRLTLQKINDSVNPHQEAIVKSKEAKNTYLEQVASIQSEVNPFTGQEFKLDRDVKTFEQSVKSNVKDKSRLENRIASLSQLYDLSFELRGQMLYRSVKSIEEATNSHLQKYFDGEIQVIFSLESSDTLEVEIQKSGYDCVYRQLSKGQRGLLKLCFGIAVMEAVGNQSGVSANMLMFDESLDGLDEAMKVKAHGLFTDLASRHPSVFLIDHSPGLQNLLDRKYNVVLKGDYSQMTLEQ